MTILLPQAGFCSVTSDVDSSDLHIAGDVSHGEILSQEILDGYPISPSIGEILFYPADR